MKALKYISQLILLIMAVINMAYSNSNDPKVDLSLVFDKAVYLPGETVTAFYRIENRRKDPLVFQHPRMEDISFKISGPTKDSLKVFFKEAPGPGEKVVLRPGCIIKIKLGTLHIQHAQNDRAVLPVGEYTIRSKTKNFIGREEVKLNGTFNINEYPLIVTISSYPEITSQDSAFLRVEMKNEGNYKISLYNILLPYENHFNLIVDQKNMQEKGPKGSVPQIKSAITLNTDEAWLPLMPGESVTLNLNITDKLVHEGTYTIKLVYTKKVLLDIRTEKPRYTEQTHWPSNEIKIIRTRQ